MESSKTTAVPVIPVAAAVPVESGMREEAPQRREMGGHKEEELPRQPTKLQSEMSRQPRSISEHYKGSGKLKDKVRAAARPAACEV
jgi:hypothetical protein